MRHSSKPARRAAGLLAVHYSSVTDEWPTPRWLFDALNAEFGFTLDPCATPANAKCPVFYTKADNGLTQDWTDQIVFMNPPYGRTIGHWMRKAYESTRGGSTVVCLVPARTDTNWWHRYAMKGEIRLVRGRLKFEGGQHPAPFPSAIIVMRPVGYVIGTYPIQPTAGVTCDQLKFHDIA